MKLAIEVNQLSKSFTDKQVLKQLNIKVPEGAVYGFLGNNGAGKSTLIRLLLGLLKPDAGNIEIDSKPVSRHDVSYKRNIGCLIDSPCLYLHLTAYEFLSISCKLKGVKNSEIDRVLPIVDMKGQTNVVMKGFSLGMKQRIALASAMIGQPKLLVLDEPTNGLDPAGMLEIRGLLKTLPEKTGVTVFLSSHLLDEIQKTATHVGILHQGRLAIESALADLLQQDSGSLEIVTPDVQNLRLYLSQQGINSEVISKQLLSIKLVKPDQCSQLNHQIITHGFELMESRYKQRTLEQMFLEIVAGRAEEGAVC